MVAFAEAISSGANPIVIFFTSSATQVLSVSVTGVFLLTVRSDLLARLVSVRGALEGFALAVLAVGLTITAQVFDSTTPLFALVPVLAWAAVRFRLGGAAAAVLIVGVAGTAVQAWFTIAAADGLSGLLALADVGSVAAGFDDSIARVQGFLLLVCAPIVGLAVVTMERDDILVEVARGRAEALRLSAEKSRLLLNVSHDLRNPLNGVIALSELMSQGLMGPINPQQAESLASINASGQQMNAMAQQLVDMAKLESGSLALDLHAVDIDAAIKQALTNVGAHPQAKGVDMRLEGEAGLVARADPVRLQQAIENLGSNAVKYGGGGCRVLMTARKVDGEQVRIEVTDYGAGIAPENVERVFRPFERFGATQNEVEGTGIGLAMTKMLVELQGGHIGFTSKPGVQTSFWIDMPLAA